MDINVIAENLAELLTNTVNLTEVYYDLFVNPTPMDVTLQMYNSNNELVEVTVPNRAKDRQISQSGEGSPEGRIEAVVGTFYVDTVNNIVYLKTTLTGNTGWQIVTVPEDIQILLDNYVLKTTTINNKSLSSNIILTASDVGALPSDIVIPVISNTYDSMSENGMSGIAVNEALNSITNKIINSNYLYSFNTGNIDNNGDSDLIAYSGADVTYKIGNSYPALTGVLPNGEVFKLAELDADNVSALADGIYKKFVGKDGAELLNNTVTLAKIAPISPNDNDVWINNAVSPLSVKKYVAPNYTEVGDPGPTISDGIVSAWNNSNNVNYVTVNGGSSTDYEIHYRLLTPNSSFTSGGTYTALYIYGINNSHTWIYGEGNALKIHGSGFSYANIADSIPDNTDYIDIIIKNNGTAFTATTYKPNGEVIKTVPSGTSAGALTLNDNTSFKITDSNFITGTPLYQIDMKYMEIYVNDGLVYTPNIPNGWVNYDKIPLGKITVSSGAVTDVETYLYNKDYISNNIVKSNISGSSGYEVYTNGYCVQWGKATANGGTVTLEVAYKNTDYNIQITPKRSDDQYEITAWLTTRTAGTFTWKGTTTYTGGMDWLTTGYIDMF